MRLPRLAAVTGTVAAIAGTAVAPADAARKNPYTPRQVCGAAFRVIDHRVVRTPKVKLGTVYLLYNPNTGRNCVAAMKSRAVGRATTATAQIRKQGANRARIDSGEFKYYAGPRKVKAPGTCVEWGGGFRVGTKSSGFLSGYEHCG